MIIFSADLALNHSGMIVFKDSKLLDYFHLTSPKKDKNMSNDVYDMLRLWFMLDSVDFFISKYTIDYSIIEDYSFGSKSGSLFQIGGFIEGVKLLLFKKNIPLRLVSPKTGKLFATGNGNADKNQIIEAVKTKWEKINFLELIFSNRKKKVTKSDLSKIEDLCDAYSLARLLDTELKLRKGQIRIQDLEEHEIQVFNRVTRKRPENILSIDFIKNNEVCNGEKK